MLVYGTGLELAYAFVTACFLLTNTLANFVNAWLLRLYGGSLTDPIDQRGPLSPGVFFGVATLVVAAAAVDFYLVARRLGERRSRRSPRRGQRLI